MDNQQLANLLKEAQSGDSKSLEKLCRHFEQIMCGYFKRRFEDPEIVNDLCQETYFRLLNNYKKIRQPLKLKSFVLKISIHVIQDHLRQKYKHDDTEFTEQLESERRIDPAMASQQDAPFLSDNVINKVDLERAVEQLPERSRQILEMQNSGYKYSEIANKMDLSESAVKMQIKRSMEKLKTLLFNVTFWLS